MRRLRVAEICLVVGLVGLLSVLVARRKFGPHLSVPSEIDLGDVAHEIHPVTLPVRNDGSKPLVISNVIVGCSGIESEFPRGPIAPGQSGTITVSVAATRFPGADGVQTVQIFSNDSRESRKRVIVRYRIHPKTGVSPRRIVLTEEELSTPWSRTIDVLLFGTDSEPSIDKAFANMPNVDVQCREDRRRGQALKLRGVRWFVVSVTCENPIAGRISGDWKVCMTTRNAVGDGTIEIPITRGGGGSSP